MSAAQASLTMTRLAVAVVLAAGGPSHAAATLARITAVTCEDAPDRCTRVIIETTAPVRYQLRRVRPDWVVVDLAGAELGAPPLPLPTARGDVQRIRLGQHEPDVVRVVIELAQPMGFTLTASPDSHAVIVTLANHAGPRRASPGAAEGRTGTETQRVVPGKSLGLIRLGMSMQDIVAVLGLSSTSDPLPDGSVDHHWLAGSGKSDLGVRTTNGLASRIWVRGAGGYAISDRVRIGSTEDDVRGALGAPSWVLTVESQAKMKMLMYDSLGVWLSIQLDEHKALYNTVFEIGIMPPERRS